MTLWIRALVYCHRLMPALKKYNLATFPKIQPKLCQFECKNPLKTLRSLGRVVWESSICLYLAEIFYGLSRKALIKFGAFISVKTFYVILFPCKILWIQITADTSKISNTVQRDFTFIFDVLLESLIGFVLVLIFLAVENVVSFT